MKLIIEKFADFSCNERIEFMYFDINSFFLIYKNIRFSFDSGIEYSLFEGFFYQISLDNQVIFNGKGGAEYIPLAFL